MYYLLVISSSAVLVFPQHFASSIKLHYNNVSASLVWLEVVTMSCASLSHKILYVFVYDSMSTIASRHCTLSRLLEVQ
jgi:hypothetical protein